MKRKLALFLTLFLLASALIPVQTFAAEGKGLETAIKTVKSLIGIDESYTEFDYHSYTSYGRTMWNLIWSKDAGGSIYVQVDDRGTIISYDHYDYNDYNESGRKLPKYSREDALEKAREFINKVNPDVLKHIEVEDSTGINNLNDPYYYLNFYRVHNGVPFPDNRVGVSVKKQTGEVRSYYYNWTENLSFPDSQKIISLEEAQKAYEKNLGLRLVYKSNRDRKNPGVYLAYVPIFGNSICVDALTGEKIDLYPAPEGGAGGNGETIDEQNVKEDAAGNVYLSPEELKAIQEVNKLLSQDKAEAMAREIKQLEITDDYNLIRAGIARNWMYQSEFTWELFFEKTSADERKGTDYINVTLDGKTGEIEGFNRNCESLDQSGEAKFDRNGAQAAVEKFLKSIIPDKFDSLNFEESPVYEIYPTGGTPRHYYFTYSRLVDGVPFIDNTVSVEIDTFTGKVENFYINWVDVEFPDKDTAISIDKAYKSLFEEIGLKLHYKILGNDRVYRPYDLESSIESEVVLVYMLEQNKPHQIDAITGEVLNYNGTPYKEDKPVAYTDISGHFAEKEINTLAEYGITLPGTAFRPNNSIVQKDFLNLLAKIENWPSLSEEETQEEIDRMYSYLIRNGVVKENEKNPAARVTREVSIKFVIRALGYDKVAELPGIFVCSFSDAEDISESMYGYVAIAGALNLINGDSQNRFNPTNRLTRGEAALIIYRMLQVD